MTAHIFRIFDSDGNDFLDFKEFLMAIDIANRDTGEGKAHEFLLPHDFFFFQMRTN